MSSPSFTESMSATRIIVQDLYELKQVTDRVGCVINPAASSYTFPTTVTVYGLSDEPEMTFEKFKVKYL